MIVNNSTNTEDNDETINQMFIFGCSCFALSLCACYLVITERRKKKNIVDGVVYFEV
jgi:hypothetical protein